MINELQLPLDLALDDAALAAVQALGTQSGWPEDDIPILLDEALDDWESSGVANGMLIAVASAILELGAGSTGHLTARTYFELYKRLRTGTTDWTGLSHTVARRLLSRTTLIAHLLLNERLSCSQIARLLRATEATLNVHYSAVALIARAVNLAPQLDPTSAGDQLWNGDSARALALFPDSTLDESCEVAAFEAAKWVPESDLTSLLRQLSRSTDAAATLFWPYLQILHWCCVPLEFFDHPASYLYEFAPRGQVASAMFARYPAVTGNPVLNNAKATVALNASWASNRGGDDAHALVAILDLLETLPFLARRQVARVLRAWSHRVIELETVAPVPIMGPLNHDHLATVATFISTSETNTQGVIEQRVVDCLSVLAFVGPGWRAKGVGDGINASNLSRHKLGDVEFTNVDAREAIALEAHGGHLSAAYVRDHQRSLSRIVEQRLAESWGDLDEPANWKIRVLFVAHSRDSSGLPTTEVLHGVPITYEYWEYSELWDAAVAASDEQSRVDEFNRTVVLELNKPTVRQSARDRFSAIAGI